MSHMLYQMFEVFSMGMETCQHDIRINWTHSDTPGAVQILFAASCMHYQSFCLVPDCNKCEPRFSQKYQIKVW